MVLQFPTVDLLSKGLLKSNLHFTELNTKVVESFDDWKGDLLCGEKNLLDLALLCQVQEMMCIKDGVAAELLTDLFRVIVNESQWMVTVTGITNQLLKQEISSVTRSINQYANSTVGGRTLSRQHTGNKAERDSTCPDHQGQQARMDKENTARRANKPIPDEDAQTAADRGQSNRFGNLDNLLQTGVVPKAPVDSHREKEEKVKPNDEGQAAQKDFPLS
jgi:hypothetical protein